MIVQEFPGKPAPVCLLQVRINFSVFFTEYYAQKGAPVTVMLVQEEG